MFNNPIELVFWGFAVILILVAASACALIVYGLFRELRKRK